jgi:hypothetical protein
MPRARHKIPTGLAVEDRFIAYGSLSLSLRQFTLLLAGVAAGYGGIWKGWVGLPDPPRVALALVPPLVALAWALARPGGRPLEQWAFVVARHATRPPVAVWRPREPRALDWRPVAPSWAGLDPVPTWPVAGDAPALGGGDDE